MTFLNFEYCSNNTLFFFKKKLYKKENTLIVSHHYQYCQHRALPIVIVRKHAHR